jgi:integrase/recombinase XerD
MLLQGLRSKEVIALNLEDVQLGESRICVHGKGGKVRLLPLAAETVHLLDHYLRLDRPAACGPALFVSLKGRARGVRVTPAGLRSLFRYHRRTSGISGAHPHRFRHTFASDMVHAGISLPALMNLMGHAAISTTMIYVQISPRDVIEQYARAAARRLQPVPPVQSSDRGFLLPAIRCPLSSGGPPSLSPLRSEPNRLVSISAPAVTF